MIDIEDWGLTDDPDQEGIFVSEVPWGEMTYEDCYLLCKMAKQSILDKLDDMMIYRFKAGINYERIKQRKAKLLQRIAYKANQIYLYQQETSH